MYKEPDVASSYRRGSGHGKTMYDLVLQLKPKVIIEFGTHCGYSAISMAQGLKDIGNGKLYSYDLWQEPTSDSHRNMTEQAILDYDVSEFIELKNGDFFEWIENPTEFDLLLVDIHNTGDITSKLSKFYGKNVLFEGGIKERDDIRPDETPIVGSVNYKLINKSFPGLSKII